MLEGWDKADSHYQGVLTVGDHKKEAQLVVDNFDKLVVVLDNLVRVGAVHTRCLVVRQVDCKNQVDFLAAVDNNLLYYFVVVAVEHIPFVHTLLKSGG